MLYAVLVYRIRSLAQLNEQNSISPVERDIYVQSALISLFTVVLALGYLILPLVTSNLNVFMALQIYAMFVQGAILVFKQNFNY